MHRGAVDGVTGSCHQLYCDGAHSTLIDCGLFQGDEASPHGENAHRLEINFDITTVQALASPAAIRYRDENSVVW